MPTNAEQIERMIIATLPEDRAPTEQELAEQVRRFSSLFPISTEEGSQLLRKLHARFAVRMDQGTALYDETYEPWLNASKPNIDPFYWNRYEAFLLRSKWTRSVTNSLSRVTDEILDLFGDPQRSGKWKRRGLVMGDVQSGKTATYTGLTCKASDAGYRLVILLTGTLENLRKQTQERLDSGFVGLDSSGWLSQQRQTRSIGVGLIDASRTGVVFTSKLKDFNTTLVNQLNFRLDAFRAEPILLVVKKNKRILENLEKWLRELNLGADGLIDTPLLLIDDEADNASVNTRDGDSDPTAINEQIRKILRIFKRSTYVGFTATPFANIFIDSDTEDEMLGDDLFPRDFIYALEPPTNYLGAEAVFLGDYGEQLLRFIEDAAPVFPSPHQSTLVVDSLPESLYEALRCFILSNAIRDLRGEGASHRSMLVNVSRFTNVQNQVAVILDDALRQIQKDIQNYSQLPPEKALQNGSLTALRKTWEREFDGQEFEWERVQNALVVAALPIAVQSVNQSKGSAALDYAKHQTHGLRIIAVGGNSLSRGLTLEGLAVSYFYRNSQMYDTLLQMGRWFGYRDQYSDLCRLWLTEDACNWYEHITEATVELRQEIKRMRQQGMTPKDFGLKVREHPDSLIVTARNKMRSARTVERILSVSGQSIETPRLFRDPDTIRNNATAVRDFVTKIEANGIERGFSLVGSGNTLWQNVPREYVSELLRRFKAHPLNMAFQGDAIAKFVDEDLSGALKVWDVVLPNGSEKTTDLIAGLAYRPETRNVTYTPSDLKISGKSARIASRGIEREGIPPDVVRKVDADYKAKEPTKNTPDKEYRRARTRPLLVIHSIVPYKNNATDRTDPEGPRVPLEIDAKPLMGLGISFPEFDEGSSQRRMSYKVNTVEWRNWFSEEIGDDQDLDDEVA